jgi:hypothetical protein
MAAAVSSDTPPSNITLTPKMLKRYRPLQPSHAILGNVEDTILSRILKNFFELIGHSDSEEGLDMTRAEDILLRFIRTKEPRGLVLPTNTSGIGGTVRIHHIENTLGFPKQLTDRLVEAARRAYVSVAEDDPSVRDIILHIKDKRLSKPTKIWTRFPTEVNSIDELKGFQNVLYTTFYTVKEDGKKKKAVLVKGRRNILDEAIAGAYIDIVEPDEEVIPTEDGPSEEEPALVFVGELSHKMGLHIEGDGSLVHKGAAPGTSHITLAYQTERGPLFALYPDIILPGEVDMPLVVMAEKLGKLVSKSQDVPYQGDIDVIRSELKELEPTKGKSDALLKNIDKIPKYLLVSKPFKPYARSTYLYASHTKQITGNPMKTLRTIRVK